MSGVKILVDQFDGPQIEAQKWVKFPALIPVEDRVARLEKLVTKLLKANTALARQVGELEAASTSANAQFGDVWNRIDRIERHLLDFMKNKGGPGYWYLDPQ